MHSPPIPHLLTVGVIADELGVPVERVCRVLRRRRHIRPAALAGNVRLFSNDSFTQIRHELSSIDTRQVSDSPGDQS